MSLGTTTTLTRDVVHYLSAATLLGPVPASQQVTVGVVLNNPNQGAEDSYLAQLYDSSSSLYQQFLDPDTFNQQFGVPATTVQAAQSWLAGSGLQVTSVEGATTYLLASGTAAQVAATFATPLNRYSAGGRTFYANAVAPTVPASLPIATVLGLNNYAFFVTPHVGKAGRPAITSAAPTGTNVPQTGALTPQTLWSIYDQPSTNLGNGQTMAIFGWGVTDGVVNDLRSFEQENELPQVPITTKSYGSTSTPDTSGDGATVEWELDTQASTGMAPDVHGRDPLLRPSQHRRGHSRGDDCMGERQEGADAGECLVRRVREHSGSRARDRRRRPRRPRRRDPEAGRDRGTDALLLDRRHGVVVPDRLGDEHERRRDPGVPGAQLPVGEPVRSRRGRHRAEQRRRQPAAALLRDRLGVRRRRQQHERACRLVSAGCRARAMRHRPERQSVRPRDADRSAVRRPTSHPSPATSPPATGC